MQANIRTVLLSAAAAFAVTATPAIGQHHGGGGRGGPGPDHGGHHDNGGGNWGRGNDHGGPRQSDNRGWQGRDRDDHDRDRGHDRRYNRYYGYGYTPWLYNNFNPCEANAYLSADQYVMQCPAAYRPDCPTTYRESSLSYYYRCLAY